MIATRRILPVALMVLTAATVACNRGEQSSPPPASAAPPAAGGGLSPFELENGIGPIKSAVSLGPVDKAMAGQGQKLFETKCVLCHKIDERYVGPALRGVAERRTGAYVMNMILNPEEMYTRHPVAKALLAEHMTQMPNLALSQEEARQLLEYFRTQGSTKAGS
jgi:mono/diheme cytochrome c family protein